MKASVDGKAHDFTLCSCLKPGTGIKVYFIENEFFYGRKGIYTVPETGDAYEDEDERIIFFNSAVMESIKTLGLEPDVVHTNDFHAGLIPVYLSIEEEDDPKLAKTGRCSAFSMISPTRDCSRPDFMEKAGLDPELFRPIEPV